MCPAVGKQQPEEEDKGNENGEENETGTTNRAQLPKSKKIAQTCGPHMTETHTKEKAPETNLTAEGATHV